jgi:hypothetical protein
MSGSREPKHTTTTQPNTDDQQSRDVARARIPSDAQELIIECLAAAIVAAYRKDN